jgi:hypothetical protein
VIRRSTIVVGVACAVALIAGAPAGGGPAGGVTGAQQKESLQRVVLVCQNEPWIECPAHPSDPGYTITGNQCDRIFHSLCDPGVPCVPWVEEESVGTLRVSAQEAAAPGSCSAEPCIDLQIDTELALDGPGAMTLDQQFRYDGFTRSTDCRDNVSFGGVRISDWFPFRSRDCVFSDGINFEGMLVPTNSGNSYNQLSELEETLIRHAQQKAGLDACEALPTSMLDFAAGGTCNGSAVQAGNALVLGAPSLPPLGQYVQRTAFYPVSVRFARTRPMMLSSATAFSGGASGNYFGDSVDADGNLLVIGDWNAGGRVRVYRRSGANWVLEKSITGSDSNGCFGASVAVSDVAFGTDTMAVGDPCAADGVGRAHVYRRFINFSGNYDWQAVTLAAPDGALYEYSFGDDVAIDGDVAVVRSPLRFQANADSTYVYRFGSSWTLEHQIDLAYSGWTAGVAIEGDVIALGSPSDAVAGLAGAGSVRVYRHANDRWVPEVVVTASSPLANGLMGVEIAFDGSWLVAGSISGVRKVHVFRREGPDSWSEEPPIVSRPGGDASFGSSDIDVSGDLLLVGAFNETVGATAQAGAAYLYRFDGSDWRALTGLSASPPTNRGAFGAAVAISYPFLAVGAPDYSFPLRPGSAYVYVLDESCAYENLPAPCTDGVTEAKIPAPPGAVSFGTAVAADGDVAVVGAVPWGQSYDGSAWVYRSDGLAWNLEQQLDPLQFPDGNFGARVAVSGDAALVAEPLRGAQLDGSGLVYRRQAGAWSLEQDLKSPTPQFIGLYGSVAVSGDVAIAGTADPLPGGQGAAHVFRRNGGWQLEDTLRSFDVAPSDDDFGTAIALSGNVALIGALGDGAGAAYVYRYRASDSTWLDEQRLPAPPGTVNFGSAVAVSGDAALVGASGFTGIFSYIGGAATGTVFAFRFDPGSGTWSQEQELVASDATDGDEFGASLALAGDLAVVGAPGAEIGRGAAYVFRHDGVGWQEERRLIADDGATGDAFGASVAIADGEVLVGAPEGNAVYAFALPPVSVLALEGAPQGGMLSGTVNGAPWTYYTYQGQTLEDTAASVATYIGWLSGACSQGFAAKSRGSRVLLSGVAPEALTVTSADPGVQLSIYTQCANGLDDDGDGLVDAADTGCAGANDTSERTSLYACDDGADNDSDGAADFPADVGCRYPDSTRESPQCQDGVDNDGDGRIDFDGGASRGVNPPTLPDAHCFAGGQYVAWDNREKSAGCGIGFELALVLPGIGSLLARARRTRRVTRVA